MNQFKLHFDAQAAPPVRGRLLCARFYDCLRPPGVPGNVEGTNIKFKIPAFAILLVCVIAALCMNVSAASYTDDMTSVASDAIKRYSGFAPYTLRGSVPDRTAFTFTSLSGASVSAIADYRAEGAETVVASIYSPNGTFVYQKGMDVYMGIFQDDMGFVLGQNLRQALLRPGTNEIYTDIGGPGKMYCVDTVASIFQFRPVGNLPGGLVGYGVRICYSLDGREFRDAPDQRHMNLERLSGLFYEQYAASIPAGAKYVRVELNDTLTVPLEPDGIVAKEMSASRLTALASVVLSGEKLRMGEPEAAVSQSVTDYYLRGETDESSGESRDDPKEKTDTSSSKVKSSSSSKFEGTITSSSKSSRENGKAQSAAPRSKAKTSKSSSEASQQEEARDDTLVYEIKRDERGGRLDSAVTVYIVAASGALVLLLVLKPR